MTDQVFIFHETTDNFRAFGFLGAAATGDNWDPSLTTVRGAAANATHIYILDLSTNPATVRVFLADQSRQASSDITMNKTGAYNGIALTDTHLVALRGEGLEYYNLTTRAYVSSMDATLPTRTSPEFYSGVCRSGNFLYLVTHNDRTFQPRIYKRNLDGSAVSDWAGQPSTIALTIFATKNRICTVRKNGGHWDRWSFDGTQDTTLNTIGAGVWAASYSTFAPPEPRAIAMVAEQNSIVLTNYRLRVRVTGNPDEVEAFGDFEFFSHYWDAENGELNIVGTPEALVSGKTWRVVATWNDDPSNPLVREITYNVVAEAPIITRPTDPLYFYKDVDYTESPVLIPIANNPNQTNIRGLLAGLGQRTVEGGQEIIGMVPDHVTSESGTLDVTTSNTGGMHQELDIPFNLLPSPNLYLLHQRGGSAKIDVVNSLTADGETVRIDLSDRIDVSSDAATNIEGLAHDRQADEFYVLNLDSSSWKIDVFSESGVHQREINLSASPISIPSRIYGGIVLDKANGFIYLSTRAGGNTIVALSFASPHTVQRTFTVTGSGSFGGIALDSANNHLYLGSEAGVGKVVSVDAATVDGGAASIIKEWTFSESVLSQSFQNIRGMTFDVTGSFLIAAFGHGSSGLSPGIAVWKLSEITSGASVEATRLFHLQNTFDDGMDTVVQWITGIAT